MTTLDVFRDAVARVIAPLADYIEQRFDLPTVRLQLRPPGAIEESLLNETCYRCGACVEICPAEAIFALGDETGRLLCADVRSDHLSDGVLLRQYLPGAFGLELRDGRSGVRRVRRAAMHDGLPKRSAAAGRGAVADPDGSRGRLRAALRADTA